MPASSRIVHAAFADPPTGVERGGEPRGLHRGEGADRGTASGTELSGENELQSSIWSDDDVTLWPGESETLTATYASADLHGATAVVGVSGWDAPKPDLVAGS